MLDIHNWTLCYSYDIFTGSSKYRLFNHSVGIFSFMELTISICVHMFLVCFNKHSLANLLVCSNCCRSIFITHIICPYHYMVSFWAIFFMVAYQINFTLFPVEYDFLCFTAFETIKPHFRFLWYFNFDAIIVNSNQHGFIGHYRSWLPLFTAYFIKVVPMDSS